MFRWLRRIVTFFSFILFVASASLCVRSYLLVDFLQHQGVQHSSSSLVMDQRILVAGRGGVCLGLKHSVWTLPYRDLTEAQIQTLHNGWQHNLSDPDAFGAMGYAGGYFHSTGMPMKFGFGRAKIETANNGVAVKARLVVFPIGVAMAVFGILPMATFVRYLKARRRFQRLAALNYNGMNTRRQAA